MNPKNYIGKENLAVLEVLAAGIILLAAAFHIYSSVQPYEGPEESGIDASYDAEENILNLTIVNGSFTEAGSREISLAFNDHRESNTTFTIHGYGKTKNTSYWATEGLLSLSSEGIARFPIQEGEKISVELEERPERFVIRGVGEIGQQPVATHYIFFENDSAIVFTNSHYWELRDEKATQNSGDETEEDFIDWYMSRSN